MKNPKLQTDSSIRQLALGRTQAANVLLCRILGNDLPPRHCRKQTLRNVEFILRNESALPRVQKRWILNRLVDTEVQQQLLQMLNDAAQDVLVIPFEGDALDGLQPSFPHFSADDFAPLLCGQILDDYRYTLLLDHAFHDSNRYVMNVNGARNVALDTGDAFGWVLPWDGNCFIHPSGWKKILEAIDGSSTEKYIIVPMERVLRNDELLSPTFTCEALEEPQIIFRSDALERFDGDLRYGRYSKVEFLRRISYPGVWDDWAYQPWENKRWTLSTDAGRWVKAGWVARLSSGRDEFDTDPSVQGIRRRSNARRTSVRNFLASVLAERARAASDTTEGILYDAQRISRLSSAADIVREAILGKAAEALQKEVPCVLDKLRLPPSKDKRDYYSVAPFWWPDAAGTDLPYVRHDGIRNPEASLDHIESLQYDSTRLQQVFDDVTALSLGSVISGKAEFRAKAEAVLDSWFVGPESMHPDLRFGQMRRGHDQFEAAGHGIIDAKDLYYFLDGLQILHCREGIAGKIWVGVQHWCTGYLRWLKNSPQGKIEAQAANNHGTCYELQVLALSRFVSNFEEVANSFVRSRARLWQQFTDSGSQPAEDNRQNPLHYRLFNVQCWLLLNHMFRRLNLRLLADFKPFHVALHDVLVQVRAITDSAAALGGSAAMESLTRIVPLLSMLDEELIYSQPVRDMKDAVARAIPCGSYLVLHPYFGIPPFWPLVSGGKS
ncbi:alginate lyase family protein [Ramlibacter henchirensis]|uniref:alginate lyase family protein n=1 Tax=Ramlibacter henchirensis TaxID=204072 RepID=UPI0014303299|nr:alginate lyase family protein [Ramlibacter henchirensis]